MTVIDDPTGYFQGFTDTEAPHPRMAATGSEGRCELCGEWESPLHDQWARDGDCRGSEQDVIAVPERYWMPGSEGLTFSVSALREAAESYHRRSPTTKPSSLRSTPPQGCPPSGAGPFEVYVDAEDAAI